MCSMNGTILCALGMGLANVPWEWDYPMCPGNKTIQCMLASQCALGIRLSNVPWEWDNPMCPEKELANVPWEWD